MKNNSKILPVLLNNTANICMFAAIASVVISWPFRVFQDEVPLSLLDDEEPND